MGSKETEGTAGYLKTDEAADYLGVDRATMKKYRNRGQLRAYQRPIDTRGDLWYKVEELQALMVFEPVSEEYIERLTNRFGREGKAYNPDTGEWELEDA